jgi:hypothetical protein
MPPCLSEIAARLTTYGLTVRMWGQVYFIDLSLLGSIRLMEVRDLGAANSCKYLPHRLTARLNSKTNIPALAARACQSPTGEPSLSEIAVGFRREQRRLPSADWGKIP